MKREENQSHDLEKAVLFAWTKKHRKIEKLNRKVGKFKVGGYSTTKHTINVGNCTESVLDTKQLRDMLYGKTE